MILWSIIPSDVILSNLTTNSEPVYEEVEYSGMKCIVEKVSSSQYQIVKLLTTDPMDYLRSELQPGTTITYNGHGKGYPNLSN